MFAMEANEGHLNHGVMEKEKSSVTRRTDLVGEPNTATEEDPADDQHGKVLRSSVEDDTHDEEDAGDEHGEAATEVAGGVGGEEGGGEARQVERGGKQLQPLVVVLAVVALLRLMLPAVHLREELDEEVIHRRYTPC